MRGTSRPSFPALAVLVGSLLLGGHAAPARAESVSVSPTRLIVAAPGRTTTLTVKAGGRDPSVLQLRVMRWKEGDNPARLKPTRDVVISPPMARLGANQELTVRILRVRKRAVRGHECYRILVDRLPGREQAGQAIRLRVRHSVPLCFES